VKKLDDKGFSLLEVMITGGLLCALGFGYMKFMDRQARSEKGRRASAEADILNTEIRGYLGKPGSCTESFKGLSIPSINKAKSIKRPNGKDKYVIGSLYGNRLIKLTALNIRNFETDTDDGLMGTAELEVLYEKQGKIVGGKHVKRQINLDVLLDESDKVVECATIGNLTISLNLGGDSESEGDSSSTSDSSNESSTTSSTSSSDSPSISTSSTTESNNQGTSTTSSSSSGTVSGTQAQSASPSSPPAASGASSPTASDNEEKNEGSGMSAQTMQKYLDGSLNEADSAKVDAIFKSNKMLQQLRDSVKATQEQNERMNKLLEED